MDGPIEQLRFNPDQLKILKLVFTYPDLRKNFLDIHLDQFMNSDLNKVCLPILSLTFFSNSPIDTRYIFDNSDSLKINSIVFSMILDDMGRVENPDRALFWDLVDTVKCNHIRDKLIPTMMDVYPKIISSSTELEILEYIGKLDNVISAVLGKSNRGLNPIEDLRDIKERLKIYTGAKESQQRRFLTGYSCIDQHIKGFATSELSVFMGATGSGKTMKLLNIAYQLWKSSNANVMFFSLEMPTYQVVRRLDSNILSIDGEILKTSKLKDYDVTTVENLSNSTNMFKIIDLPPGSSPRKIEEYILTAETQPDVVVVDYLGLMGSSNGRRQELWRTLTEASMECKMIAKKYGICVISASQITGEAAEKDDVQDFTTEDIAGAKGICHNSDLVIGTKYNEETRFLTCYSVKSRDSSKFTYNLFADYGKAKLYEPDFNVNEIR